MTFLEPASTYLAAGLSILPAIAAEKRPAVGKWKRYQQNLPTEHEVQAWFSNGVDATCLITGAVSGNLELIDFDCQGVAFEPWRERVEAASPGLMEKLYIETSPSGGRHVVYRCDQEVCGSIKLAQRMDPVDPGEPTPDGTVIRFGKKYQARKDESGGSRVLLTLIETRGEGGLFLCAPTPGYEAVQGDLSQLSVLSGAQRDVLLQAAWDLNEYVPPMVNGPTNISHICGMSAENPHMSESPSHIGHGGADISHNGGCAAEISNRPGDDFNRRGDVRTVLAQCGWSCVKGGENEYWRRPGKTSGWSATLRDGVLYVFSSSAAPFEPNRAYSPFSVYALLLCGGDFEQAARSLRQSGYGGDSLPQAAPDVNISGILGMSGAQAAENSEIPLTPKSLGDLLSEHPQLRKPVIHGLLREGETMNVIASPKVGKALAVETPILTDRGWMTMGDIRPGMKVHARDGSLTTVVAVTEPMHGRPCYRVDTRSGARLLADANHQWVVSQRGREEIVTTEELAKGRNGRRWLLPVAAPVERKSAKLPLDPWLLGYWLGNGTTRDGGITVNTLDIAHVHTRILKAGFDIGLVTHKAGATSFTVIGLKPILRKMHLLHNKHIPQAYLTASIEQRANLLAGLLDSDGHAVTRSNGSGLVEYTTTEKALALSVLTLVRSLGRKNGFCVGPAMFEGRECGIKMRITFAASRADSPFYLPRKTDALPERPLSPRSYVDAVVAVEPIPSVPVKCIQVDHPSGTFLAGEMLTVTHNSWLVIDLALSVATGRPWFGMECEAGEVLIIDNELHGETSANRIPKVAQARGIRISEVAERIHVQNLRGHLQDLFALGPYFRQFEPGRFKIVILDAFYRFLPVQADENDNGTMANLYNCLDAFAGYLKCCFILIHHTSKGNQSQKGVTDVGAGAGAQSRATDTHLVLRRHESPDAVVMDAAVRSWPPIDPLCLRWAFPVWTPADDLDPAVLQGSGSRGGSRRSTPEPEPEEMGVRDFVEAYFGPEPTSRAKLAQALKASGMKASHAKNLLEIALEDRLVYRWDIGNNLYGFATEPQPEDDLAVRKSPSKGDRVRQVIASNPSMDNQAVADECGVSPRYVRRIRAEIEEQGGTAQ